MNTIVGKKGIKRRGYVVRSNGLDIEGGSTVLDLISVSITFLGLTFWGLLPELNSGVRLDSSNPRCMTAVLL